MPTLTAIASALLACLLAFAAVRKLSHREEVVRGYLRVGVPESRLDQLAAILLAAAAGLLAGIVWSPIGIAAAAGVVVYFAVAIGAHVLTGDAAHLPTPVTLELLALATLALRLAVA